MEKFLIKDSKRNNYNYTILRLPGLVGKNSQHNFLSNFVMLEIQLTLTSAVKAGSPYLRKFSRWRL